MRAPKEITVLIVDDNDLLREAIVRDFRRKGFSTCEASNGRDAFEIVKNQTVDVAISDVHMPGGDGIEFLRNVKEYRPNLPVMMFITGFADITLDEAYDLGADAVFAKPFERKSLLATVLRAVSDKNEVWSRRLHERIDTDLDIQFESADRSSQNAVIIQGQVKNIGRGGVFVAMPEDPTGLSYPDIGEAVEFRIRLQLDQNDSPLFAEGKGVVRWIRKKNVGELQSGCGIEFMELSDSCKAEIIRSIESSKRKQFIPRG